MKLNPVLEKKGAAEVALIADDAAIASIRDYNKSLMAITANDIIQDDKALIASMKGSRALALESLGDKIADLPADKLVTAIEQLTKTINTAEGKGEGNINIVFMNDEKRNAIIQRIKARTIE